MLKKIGKKITLFILLTISTTYILG